MKSFMEAREHMHMTLYTSCISITAMSQFLLQVLGILYEMIFLKNMNIVRPKMLLLKPKLKFCFIAHFVTFHMK